MYPKIVIHLNKLKHNVNQMIYQAHDRGITIMGVTKVFCADMKIVQTFLDANIDYLADSRMYNLRKYQDAPIEKVLLRIPMQSRAYDVVKYADISLNSELTTIHKLNIEAKRLGVIHKVILMIDFGDLREGIFFKDDSLSLIDQIEDMEYISLIGIGTNLTCYGGIIPNEKVYKRITDTVDTIEFHLKRPLEIISGGNSSSISLMLDNKLPSQINNLRLGESIVLGRETAYGTQIKNMFDDAITLEAEIVELKRKPSMPIGEIGMNAFGQTPTFKDIGIHNRAIIAIGKQDVDYKDLKPVDDEIEILGGSSDHIILNIERCKKKYKVGDIIQFKLTYGSVLSLFTSKYVYKEYLEEK